MILLFISIAVIIGCKALVVFIVFSMIHGDGQFTEAPPTTGLLRL